MTFHSLLYHDINSIPKASQSSNAPPFFANLNLDQIVAAITANKEEYHLKPFFYTPVRQIETIQYRHDIMRDVENPILFERLQSFAHRMQTMRTQLTQANQLYYPQQRKRLFLDAIAIYCRAIHALAQDLSQVKLASRGLLSFYDHVKTYLQSRYFIALYQDTERLLADFAAIHYCILIKDNSVTVGYHDHEENYSIEIEQIFNKFRQTPAKDYSATFSTDLDMNHIEAQILNRVAQLYPDPFTRLEAYHSQYTHYIDAGIAQFDQEIQFYIAYLEYMKRFQDAGLTFCYPKLSDQDKQVHSSACFDLALANKLINEQLPIVCNDFYLHDPERIMIVSGPNQGGKTTFARTFGQLHYLASLGCPVPGRAAQLFLFDNLFTHFEKQKNIKNQRSKLEDDLLRIHDILIHSTPNSLIIMNEIFSSTTLQDAIFLSKKIMEKLVSLDTICVWVTFITELTISNEKTVSMVSIVNPDNLALRTFKILRCPANDTAYAITLAEKYHLTYHDLQARIPS